MIDEEITYCVLSISSLVEPQINPNSMPDEDYGLLVHGIESEGFLQPILVRDNGDETYEIVDGVHRSRAASEVGYTELPCKVLPEGYSDDKVELLRLAMNKLRGQLSSTSAAHILDRIAKNSPELDLSLSGYSLSTARDLIASVQEIDLDELMTSGMGGFDEETDRDEDQDKPRRYSLELDFATAKQLASVKKKLKRLGGGDPAEGLITALEDY